LTHPDGNTSHALVTGGAGFIGSHLVESLIARGDCVTVIDDLSTGQRSNLHPEARFIHQDVRDGLAVLTREKTEIHEIYHLAAAVGVQLVLDDPVAAIEVNVGRTSDVLRFAQELSHTPRVLIASSSEVYGKGARTPFHEDDDVVFGPTSIARWSYGYSKALDEFLAISLHAQRGLPTVVARFFNTVGPRQIGVYGMVLPRFVQAALEGKPLRVFGDGSQTRCFCDVRDVSAALPHLLACDQALGRVFNIGSDREISILELANLVIEVTGSTSTIEQISFEKAFGPGFEDLPRRVPDLGRIRQAIGFEPTWTLEQTIMDVVEYCSAGGRTA
jgi:UDP-glucose 4-epimerase